MSSKLDLTSWPLTEETLGELEHMADVRIHLAYPGYRPFLHLLPGERRQAIAARYRQDYHRLRSVLHGHPFQRLGSHLRPVGVAMKLRLHQLPALLAEPVIDSVSIEAIEGLTPLVLPPEPSFWCLLARFVIQVEHTTGGLQTYELRHVVVRAFTQQEAEAKLTESFARSEEPYLNSAGYLVRWHFEAFTDCYELTICATDAFSSEEGVEVFSKLHQRRMVPTAEWHPTPTASS